MKGLAGRQASGAECPVRKHTAGGTWMAMGQDGEMGTDTALATD